ncbi:glutamate-cysteine ligase family protein [Streptantibioticus rubrisoli]|uniref:Glutamate--cysteine ligase n=1 Tax=Streptantibioticus rubrisoli TaxID=1387313 RepID=A0ABT1P6P1_9ACTN|nr:glutamate-cysteine ligase family protein [Streptantibioticus rubrisoli]MCQ4041039.1 glutamate-cysteine ligase family protein [Streptantibioticus rubrisoli]
MNTTRLRRDELRSLFAPAAVPSERIGLEIESGIVDPETGLAAPYAGDKGVKAVLETLLAEWGGQAQHDAGELIGVKLADGVLIGLEPGGQVEYSSAPAADLATVVDETRAALERLSEIAEHFGWALVPGAYLPFDRIETIPWVPMSRARVMRDFFAGIGDAGRDAPKVLSMSLCTQVHLDFLSDEDFTRKLRMQAAASPVVAALFVNSPLQNGRLTGLLSHRSHDWLRTDPRRCGLLGPALRGEVSADDVIDWALGLRMIYRLGPDGRYRPAPDRPFAVILERGYEDGSMPTFADWVSHLTQTWTHVRPRRTLELRAADGPHHQYIPAVPALWVGLSYHPPSCEAAWELLGHYSVEEQRSAMLKLPVEGLRTALGGDRIDELAGELVRLARKGLRARVDAGLEHPKVLEYLDPIDEVLQTGRTFAEQCARRWETDMGRDPRRYVAAFRV